MHIARQLTSSSRLAFRFADRTKNSEKKISRIKLHFFACCKNANYRCHFFATDIATMGVIPTDTKNALFTKKLIKFFIAPLVPSNHNCHKSAALNFTSVRVSC